MRPKDTSEGRFVELEGKDIHIIEFGLAGGIGLTVDDAGIRKKIQEAKEVHGNRYDYWNDDQVVTIELNEAAIVALSLALQGFKNDCYTEVPTEGTMTWAKREKAFEIANAGLAYMTAFSGNSTSLRIMQDDAIAAKQARLYTPQ